MGTNQKTGFDKQSVDFNTADPRLLEVLRLADRVAPTQASVLIQGESGTGKEVLARRIHTLSHRAKRPMVSLNCGAIQESLLLSELFGHEKGAFTGATSRKTGLAELAHGGTLFLDEIGEMGLDAQAKLLRFLQEGECLRVGGQTPLQVDTRLICATNRDLAAQVKGGRFREDLYYRINTVSLHLLPLRQRKGDTALLAAEFLNSGHPAKPKKFSPEALELLEAHSWPGNVRELMNAIERFNILVEDTTISAQDVKRHIQVLTPAHATALTGPMELAEVEKHHILNVLAHFQGNKTRAAGAMGITVKTLYNKLARYGQHKIQHPPQ